MSALQGDPESFVQYCMRRNLETSQGDFLPRSEYGRYLTSLLNEAIASTTATVSVDKVSAEVTGLKASASGVTLSLADLPPITADHVLLAFGNLAPLTPKPFAGVKDHHSYQDSPWCQPCPPEGLGRPTDSVLLIGSGLTALDMVTRLATQGHTGKVVALSRRGLHPQVHRGHPHYAAQHAETTRLALSKSPATARNYLKVVRRLVSQSPDVNWRDIIAAMRPCTPELWNRLTQIEKRRFLRHARPYWDNHRHRAAPEGNEIFDLWKQSGQLTVAKGRVLSVDVADDQLICRILQTTSRAVKVSAFDRVINCTGPNTSVLKSASLLIKQLVEDGTIVSDPLELGILLTNDFSVVTSKGIVLERLSYVGPMLKSLFWEATAVPELRQHVSAHAARLAQRFNHDVEQFS